jgi:nucleotidyltransferase substrate binding protein (TIGR01987 family)
MERLTLRYNDTVKALETLHEILEVPFSVIIRDAAIQHFEYTFEALWKFLKEYMKETEGVVVNTPKAVFRAVFPAGFLTKDETARRLEMTDRRDETVLHCFINDYNVLCRVPLFSNL